MASGKSCSGNGLLCGLFCPGGPPSAIRVSLPIETKKPLKANRKRRDPSPVSDLSLNSSVCLGADQLALFDRNQWEQEEAHVKSA
jgi:hypothetical protein